MNDTRYIIELDNASMGFAQNWQRFVCEDGKAWDGGWMTKEITEAKQWKTEAGAQRWLAQRECIKGKVRTVQIERHLNRGFRVLEAA